MRMKKRHKSAAKTPKWRERQSAEQSSEIWQTNWTGRAERHACLSEEQRSEIQQTNQTGHAEGHACLSEEQRHDIRQTNRMGHAEGHAHLSEERHAERRARHDMDVVHKEKDSYDNCYHRDFSFDPIYKSMFTVVSNEEIHTCKLARVKSRRVHDPALLFTLCQECERCLKKTPNYLSMTSSQKEHMFDWKNILPSFLWDVLSGCNASNNVPYY
jgi:hypothetical protein